MSIFFFYYPAMLCENLYINRWVKIAVGHQTWPLKVSFLLNWRVNIQKRIRPMWWIKHLRFRNAHFFRLRLFSSFTNNLQTQQIGLELWPWPGFFLTPQDDEYLFNEKMGIAGDTLYSDWWFGTFFIFHNIWDNPSHWLIFFQDG